MPKRRIDKGLTAAALLFAALGDPTRLTLLRQLSEGGPASISLLAEEFSMTRQGVTKHLQVLASAGVIDGSRQGREQVWTLNPKRLAEGRRHLDLIAAGWDEALARFKMLAEE
ncbi:MAG: ArsR/SmtB family transcription factor [Vicinamibacterales bacterium]